eukprot:1622784-Amphidinium_carterae.2
MGAVFSLLTFDQIRGIEPTNARQRDIRIGPVGSACKENVINYRLEALGSLAVVSGLMIDTCMVHRLALFWSSEVNGNKARCPDRPPASELNVISK